MTAIDEAKKNAGYAAADFVKDGMVVGLGSGTTVVYFIKKLGERIKEEKLEIIGIPTSIKTEGIARKNGIRVSSLDEHPVVDIAVDGADEFSPQLDLIKGLGGALLREKMVAYASKQFVVIVDWRKRVSALGTRSPLPVEVIRFSWKAIARWVEKTLSSECCVVSLRELPEGRPYITDNGNYILDCRFEKGIQNPAQMEKELNTIPGVVENGLFIDMADVVLVGEKDGSVSRVEKEE